MSPAKIDGILRGLKHFGPYGVFLAFGGLGASIFTFGGMASAVDRLDVPSELMRWSGASLCLLSAASFMLWHFFHWPPWMLIAPSPPVKATRSARSRTT